VAHDFRTGEFVAQIPFFPPLQVRSLVVVAQCML
jgi:hypothetical protein